MQTMNRRRILSLTAAACGAALAGCGFRLRGLQQQYAFKSIYFTGAQSGVVALLKRMLTGGPLTVVEKAEAAEVTLTVLRDQTDQVASAVNASASVREIELRQFFDFTLTDDQDNVLIENARIHISRFMSYKESEATAKESEIASMFNHMRNDIAAQVLRRLAVIQLP